MFEDAFHEDAGVIQLYGQSVLSSDAFELSYNQEEELYQPKFNTVTIIKSEGSYMDVSSKYIAYVVRSSIIRVIDISSGSKLVMKGHSHSIAELKFSPSNPAILLSADSTIDAACPHLFVWSLFERENELEFSILASFAIQATILIPHPLQEKVCFVAYKNVFLVLLTSSDVRALTLTDVDSSVKVPDNIDDMSVSPDGSICTILIGAKDSYGSYQSNYSIHIYNVLGNSSSSTYSLDLSYTLPLQPHESNSRLLCLKSRLISAISGPISKNDFNQYLATYTIVLTDLVSKNTVQRLTITLPVNTKAMTSVTVTVETLSPLCMLLFDVTDDGYFIVTSCVSSHVCVLSMSKSRLFVKHGAYLDLKHANASATVNTVSEQDHQRLSKVAMIEISCYQSVGNGEYVVQQYQTQYASVVPEEDSAEPSFVTEPSVERSLGGGPPSPTRSLMSILSNSANKSSVLTALFPPKLTQTPSDSAVIPPKTPQIPVNLSSFYPSPSPHTFIIPDENVMEGEIRIEESSKEVNIDVPVENRSGESVSNSPIGNQASSKLLSFLNKPSSALPSSALPSSAFPSSVFPSIPVVLEEPKPFPTLHISSSSILREVAPQSMAPQNVAPQSTQSIAPQTVAPQTMAAPKSIAPQSVVTQTVDHDKVAGYGAEDRGVSARLDVIEKLLGEVIVGLKESKATIEALKRSEEKSAKNMKNLVEDCLRNKSFTDEVGESVSARLDLRGAFRGEFEGAIIPAFQTGVSAMFNQMQLSVEAGVGRMQSAMDSQQTRLVTDIALIASAIEGLKAGTVQTSALKEEVEQPSADPLLLLSQGRVMDAVEAALELRSVDILLSVLASLVPSTFSNEASEVLLLCLAQQLAIDFATRDPPEGLPVRVEWLKSLVMSYLDKSPLEFEYKLPLSQVLDSLKIGSERILSSPTFDEQAMRSEKTDIRMVIRILSANV